MKKLSKKTRLRDVERGLKVRKKAFKAIHKAKANKRIQFNNGELTRLWRETNQWVDSEAGSNLNIAMLSPERNRKQKKVVIYLPEKMNFSDENEKTIIIFTAIRKLVAVLSECKSRVFPHKAYFLVSVNFDNLKEISTSAALVLTAEISKWDSIIRNNLVPVIDRWDDKIYCQLYQLGFFKLFNNKPEKSIANSNEQPNMNFVPYMRAISGDRAAATEKKKELKNNILNLIGREEIENWTILHSALSEAVTNVTHHAYDNSFEKNNKAWYLTGSFDNETKEMKIAFYDQGLGIPKTLPASRVWEKVINYFSKYKIKKVEQIKHSTLLEAAVKIDRTSTKKNDRGKGLQDLLEFIRSEGEGYLSIISLYGSYNLSISNGKEKTEAKSLKKSLPGTLIIWCVTLR